MGGGLKVLLVDDEPMVGKRLAPALTKCGYEVEFYDDPAAALERVDTVEFDVVVTDIRMSNIDGIQVLRRVRERSRRTAVVIITGYATMSLAREAMKLGAFDFIAKPFTPDELRDIVGRAAKSLSESSAPEEGAYPE